MKDILKRYIAMTAVIATVMIILNMVFVKLWISVSEDREPESVIRFLNGVSIDGDNCSVSDDCLEFAQKNYEWIMVLNDTGKVVYSYALPKELNKDYSVGDISTFADGYIDDYPVEICGVSGGLVVAAGERNSVWKTRISVSRDDGVALLAAAVVFNVVVAVVLACLLSLGFARDLKSVVSGILHVSEDGAADIPETGSFRGAKKAINAVSDKLNRQGEIIRKNNRLKEEWLAGVSHDIRTPLAIIVGKSEELMEDEADEDKLQSLEVIRNQSFKIKHVVNDLNLINNLDSSSFEISMSVVDVNRLLRECVADVMNMYGQDKYEFVMDGKVTEKNVCTVADGHLLKRAFENILINSVVHNPGGCRVNINITEGDTGVSVIFEDDGGDVDEICLRGLNADCDNDVENPHGWGTVVVKRIAEMHGGKAVFEAATGGMKVSITIPVERQQKLG